VHAKTPAIEKMDLLRSPFFLFLLLLNLDSILTLEALRPSLNRAKPVYFRRIAYFPLVRASRKCGDTLISDVYIIFTHR
jgi:hypothetical protein